MKQSLIRGLNSVLLCTLLAGCSQSVKIKVESEVPKPVMASIPVAMGVYYAPEFRNYVYTEDTADRPEWAIDTGSSHYDVFQQILPVMFQSLTEVPAVPANGANVRAVIVPSVNQMQFALPQETKFDMYEAWVSYNISVVRPDGTEIAKYSVDGYGKSEYALLKSRDEGLSAAINLALRDAGAKMALGFSQVTEVKDWLATESAN